MVALQDGVAHLGTMQGTDLRLLCPPSQHNPAAGEIFRLLALQRKGKASGAARRWGEGTGESGRTYLASPAG